MFHIKFFSLFILGFLCAGVASASTPTANLYKIMRNGQQRVVQTVKLKKTRDGGYILRVPQEDLEAMEFLQITPSMAIGHQGEQGYFINNDGLLTRFDTPRQDIPYKKQWEEKYLIGEDFTDITDGVQHTLGWDEGSLCISGYHEDGGKTWLAIKEGMKFESRQLVKLKNGEYSLNEAYYLKDIRPYEDLTILFYPIKNNSYTDIALKYRQWLLDKPS